MSESCICVTEDRDRVAVVRCGRAGRGRCLSELNRAPGARSMRVLCASTDATPRTRLPRTLARIRGIVSKRNETIGNFSSGEGIFRMGCSDLRAVLFPSSHLCLRSSLFSRPAVPVWAVVVRGNARGVSSSARWPPARTARRHSIGDVAVPARDAGVV